METPPTLMAVRWEPTPTIHVWMTILSTVVALIAGCTAFLLAFGGKDGMITFDPVGRLVALGLVIVSVLAHEGVHGLAIPVYRGRPTFGAGMAGKLLPYFYCTAAGQRLSVALRAPRGSRIEDMKDGLVIHTPAP